MTHEEDVKKFTAWLDEVEADKGWTDNKFAIAAGISSSVLSKARSGTLPRWDACLALAEALEISPIRVFRKAGLMKDYGPEDEVTFEDWKGIIVQMSPGDEQEMRDTALRRIERRKKEEAQTQAGSLRQRTD